MRPARILLACACAMLAAACTFPRDARIATGYISHTLCTAAFVSGLDPDQVYEDEIRPMPDLWGYGLLVRREVDREHVLVEASLAGGYRSAAEYRGDRGCVTVDPRPEGSAPNPAQVPFPRIDLPIAPVRDALVDVPSGVVEPADPRLRVALDRAFAEPEEDGPRATRAVVIVHRGRILAERYAPGFGIGTRLLGYSASKSVTSALVGILVRKGLLHPGDRAPVPEWSAPGDPRSAISIDDLLRMRTGLQWEEAAIGGGSDTGTEMIYLAPDMAHFAADLPLIASPGTLWQYNSGNAMILSRILAEKVGGGGEGALRFAREELFLPLGMQTATIESDAAGTPMGAAGVLASARDWARFGELYAGDGVVQGRRILPRGWVDYSALPTPGAEVGYGAGFWTNRGGGEAAAQRIAWGMPRDALFAHGFLGQVVVIVPSRHLVVVRFGYSHDPLEELEGISHLVGDAIAALDAPPPVQARGGAGGAP